MSFIRRTLSLFTGVAAGVGTAPYLCSSERASPPLPSHPHPYAAHRSASRFYGGGRGHHSSSSRCEEDVVDATNGLARVTCVSEALWTFYRCAYAVLATAVRALVDGTGMNAATAAAGSCRVANATAAEHRRDAWACRDVVDDQRADRHLRVPTDEGKLIAESVSGAEVPPSVSTQSELMERTAVFRTAPHKVKDRFLRYARRNPATGELVLDLEGFVRCMLLLPDDSGMDAGWLQADSVDAVGSGEATQPSPSASFSDTGDIATDLPFPKAISGQGQLRRSSSWLQELSPQTRQRFVELFRSARLGGSNSIGYAEFVVLFTFLSTPQRTLERAFAVFDLDEKGRLSEWELCHLLNTIMVDPAVQVRYAAAASASGSAGDDAAALPSSARDSQTSEVATTAEAPYLSSCTPSLTQRAYSPAVATVASVASASGSSTESRAGTSRRSEKERQRHKNDLVFEISSEMMRSLLFGPLPLHVGASHGSTCGDYNPVLAASLMSTKTDQGSAVAVGSAASSGSAAVASSMPDVAALPMLSDSAWWRPWGHTLRCFLGKVWSLDPSCAPVSDSAESSALHLTSITPAVLDTPAATQQHMSQLQLMAQEDALLHMISYQTLVYRLDNLRWELRAIEFGLCDPSNTGTISLDDCRRLLYGDRRRLAAKGYPAQHQRPAEAVVSWQFYHKMFNVVRESDKIMAALQLTLDAMPPVPEETLRGGAIPDEALEAATQAIPAMVRLSVLQNAYSTAGGGGGIDVAPMPATVVEASQEGRSNVAESIPFIPAVAMAANAVKSESVSETRAAARDMLKSLVRPTALTWNQFSRVLTTIGVVKQLSEAEKSLFRALLDEDGSDSLSPAEFARVCALKEAFFADQLPRFDEPKRNAIQQFFYCMQQLE
ncbi:hypothetical protein LSCM4_01834 [Leishmania orientalis]|uniref:EF-hand domain-containing protein n=1 Tax=Leishmania orientalis TaxID=2249476 RepID=A0A836HLZ2_9TRYP|nr:hypothetical protein LSCM4_01834 [Leishmania orientalis]